MEQKPVDLVLLRIAVGRGIYDRTTSKNRRVSSSKRKR